MSAMPGFSAEASLGLRTAGRGAWKERSTAGVVPAVDCEHHCFLMLVDCVLAHGHGCQDRYHLCQFFCKHGPAS